MMGSFESGIRNIVILADPAKAPFFPRIIQDALATIKSKPLGKKLLSEISNGPTITRNQAPVVTYAVAILPPQGEIRATPGGLADFSPGNLAKRASEESAVFHNRPSGAKGGKAGSATAIFFNPNIISTPNGDRPAFIGLAHELIHAWRNAKGFGKMDENEEEREVVGLSLTFSDITENGIRAEHNIPKRRAYNSLTHECAWLASAIG